MAFNDGVRVGPIAYIGLVSVLVTLALVLLLQVLYYQRRNSLMEANLAAEGVPQELSDLTSEQQTALTKRGYVDQDRGIVAVGVERAKELVLKELANGKDPSEVTGPKRPAAPPAIEAAKDEAGDEPKTDATAAEADGPSKVKQEPEDDDKS